MGSLYRLYIDESGDHTYNSLHKLDRRYLALTGTIFNKKYYDEDFVSRLERLKGKHFTYDPDEPLILSRKEIVNRRGAFGRLKDRTKQAAFNEDILALYQTSQYQIVTVVIDKQIHIERYGEAAWHPYHYCLEAMLERYCGLLRYIGGRGDVMAESRAGKEDMALKKAFSHIYNYGTRYHPVEEIQQTLTSSQIKLSCKRKNVAGLQLSDLIVYASKHEILLDHDIIPDPGNKFWKQVSEAIQGRYNYRKGTGKIKGYGKVFLK